VIIPDINDMTLRIITAHGCHDCHEIQEALDLGGVELIGIPEGDVDLEVVDVTTDDGHPYFAALGAQRIPSAFLGPQECQIYVKEPGKSYTINCEDSANGEEENYLS